MPKYPTEWSHGIPRGYILDRGINLLLTVTDNNGKPHRFTYKIAVYKTKEAALKDTEGEKIRISHEFEVTRNEARFTDKNTIEVKINLIGKNKGKEKFFKTDAKHLNILNKYPLQAKLKREKKPKNIIFIARIRKRNFHLQI